MLKKDKPRELEEVKKLMEQYSVIGILDLHKLPAKVLLKIRNSVKGIATIRMSSKSVLERAIKETKKGEELISRMRGSPALVLSNENPFKLYSLMKRNRATGPAKAGDVVQKDIVIKKGPTTIAPGPAISTLQKIGLKTRVEGGKIAVSDDKVIIKAGEKVTEDAVGVLSLLKIEPIEIMLDVVAIWDGTVYDKAVLDVDPEEYIRQIQECVQKAINLSVNSGYPTKLTIDIMLAKAFAEAKTLCIDANIFEKEVIGDILANAVSQAKSLSSEINFQEV
ncbi:MAG: 50S ribosomal protein L10 [Candidatus Aenigmarchaeota archaeon]|nr:50S ribosomal protein L10 [Candidatus Aenigmarchaeota archaeon]